MSVKDSTDKILELHESLIEKEDKKDSAPVIINSQGDIEKEKISLKEALQTLVKYAKMLEEADDKKASQETEADVSDKD